MNGCIYVYSLVKYILSYSDRMITKNNQPLVVAQFSDSHLFAQLDGLHHNANVFNNLKRVLTNIAANPTIDYAIFTGDLTQDHSDQSYINFAEAVRAANVDIPVLYLAGNHDDPNLLQQYLVGKPFNCDKKIESEYWQIQLIDSKSVTPAGLISDETLTSLPSLLANNKYKLLMMHHHPIDVGYFIDKHGLENKDDFWQTIAACNTNKNIKAIACGHIHRASVITCEIAREITCQNNKQSQVSPQKLPSVDLYTCPATSIQFDPSSESVKALAAGPAYRLFYLQQNGTLSSNIVYL